MTFATVTFASVTFASVTFATVTFETVTFETVTFASVGPKTRVALTSSEAALPRDVRRGCASPLLPDQTQGFALG
ncbi:MAG TPA: hypothetical protein VFS76_04850 [Pyrinomonadaceae bacterium]|nr:hypothetical protein [Pyrinomonadaceae bacterium]